MSRETDRMRGRYGPGGPVRFAISLAPNEVRHLDALARLSGMRRAELAASLIRHVLADDAVAHGAAS